MPVCEPFGLLSLTVKVNFKVLETEEIDSQVEVNLPDKTFENSGKYLSGELVGGNDLKTGPDGLVADAILLEPD